MSAEKMTETETKVSHGQEPQITDMETFAARLKHLLEQTHPFDQPDIHELSGNNGRVQKGIAVLEDGSCTAFTVCSDGLCGQCRRGASLTKLCHTADETKWSAEPDAESDSCCITELETVKGRIFYKLINAERNAKRLQELPHRLWNDLAVVYHVPVRAGQDGISSHEIDNQLMEMWGVDESVLYESARRNTPMLFKPQIKSMAEMARERLKGAVDLGKTAEMLGAGCPESWCNFYIAGNKCMVHGASVMLYDRVLKEFAEKVKGDFYILPLSMHQIMFLPIPPRADETELPQMVCGINVESVNPEEALSNNVYRYHAENGHVSVVR